MCLAIPMKLVERRGDNGTADLDNVRIDVVLSLCPEAKAGDWLVVHAGFALAVLDEQEANETRLLLKCVSGTES